MAWVLPTHRLLHRLLPLFLGIRGLAADRYQRLLIAYQRDFLQKQREYPDGVAYRLVEAAAAGPQSRAYRFQAPPGVSHRPGQTLLVRWSNAPDEVDRLLDAAGWQAAQPVSLRTASSAFSPGRMLSCPLREALLAHVEIRAPRPDPACPAETGLPPTLAAVLAATPGRVAQVLATQPRVQPRSYSISAITPTAAGEIVEILVSDVDECRRDAGGIERRLPGRCTGFLAALPRPGGEVRAWPLAFPLAIGAGAPRSAADGFPGRRRRRAPCRGARAAPSCTGGERPVGAARRRARGRRRAGGAQSDRRALRPGRPAAVAGRPAAAGRRRSSAGSRAASHRG